MFGAMRKRMFAVLTARDDVSLVGKAAIFKATVVPTLTYGGTRSSR